MTIFGCGDYSYQVGGGATRPRVSFPSSTRVSFSSPSIAPSPPSPTLDVNSTYRTPLSRFSTRAQSNPARCLRSPTPSLNYYRNAVSALDIQEREQEKLSNSKKNILNRRCRVIEEKDEKSELVVNPPQQRFIDTDQNWSRTKATYKSVLEDLKVLEKKYQQLNSDLRERRSLSPSTNYSYRSGSASYRYRSDKASPTYPSENASLSYMSDTACHNYMSDTISPSYLSDNASPSYLSDNASPSYRSDNASPSYRSDNASLTYRSDVASHSYLSNGDKHRDVLGYPTRSNKPTTQLLSDAGEKDWSYGNMNTDKKQCNRPVESGADIESRYLRFFREATSSPPPPPPRHVQSAVRNPARYLAANLSTGIYKRLATPEKTVDQEAYPVPKSVTPAFNISESERYGCLEQRKISQYTPRELRLAQSTLDYIRDSGLSKLRYESCYGKPSYERPFTLGI